MRSEIEEGWAVNGIGRVDWVSPVGLGWWSWSKDVVWGLGNVMDSNPNRSDQTRRKIRRKPWACCRYNRLCSSSDQGLRYQPRFLATALGVGEVAESLGVVLHGE